MTSYILSGSFGSGRGLWSGPPAEHSSGGARHDGLEIRVARLEVIAEHTQRDIIEVKMDVRELRKETKAEIGALRTEVRTDFRVMFGALITVALGLAGLMAKGFGWY